MLGRILRKDDISEADWEKIASAMEQHDLFSGLPEKKLPSLIPACRIKEFQDEEIVCHCPDASHDAFLVLDGKAAIILSRNGLTYILELAGFGGVFNVEKLVDAANDDQGGRALGRVKLLAMDAAMLKKLFKVDPTVGYPFIRNLANLLMAQYQREISHLVGSDRDVDQSIEIGQG